MHAEALPRALRWTGERAVFDAARDALAGRVTGAFGAVVEEIRATEPAVHERLLAAVTSADPGALLRVLLAPETVARLLDRGHGDATATARFIHHALRVEAARAGSTVRVSEPIWSALGDTCLEPDGSLRGRHAVAGLAAVDLESPYAAALQPAIAASDVAPLNAAERRHVLETLARAQREIARTSAAAARFVADFTSVVLLRGSGPIRFASGSSPHYLGRCVMVGSTLTTVDEAKLADAVVHEAIHGLLFELQLEEAWAPPEVLHDQAPKIRSPWTGARLRIDPFLHACFVWYGLARFWSLAVAAGTFPPGRAEERGALATRGFHAGGLADCIPPGDRVRLDPRVTATLEELQRRALEADASGVGRA